MRTLGLKANLSIGSTTSLSSIQRISGTSDWQGSSAGIRDERAGAHGASVSDMDATNQKYPCNARNANPPYFTGRARPNSTE
ncbi:histidyl-tRNA synthetase, mitochondrial precursor [Aspergillus luchuensis]|uniref:Histidyl-tRNA synthetase, mitochondrial n=1 Tax=Aspergillus kawachii TaxID=1069201 RepID=A0A146EX59_ASPKA|nr:histidyl-tRNA synthetase, mitochondrial precursor [Aspergillus luchuensis]